ncbi:MAG: HAD family hydrolase [Schwartzia sp.]|nr:HAD family hydrolase [Schwartzia sp. (in: firmicutes)]
MAYRAAVFDLDGTLLNTLSDLADSGNELLASYGMPSHPESAFRYFVGNGSRKLMERILPGKSAEEIDEALVRYKAIYEKRLTAKTKPYAGIAETLSELKARGVRMAVCTNKHISAAEALIRKYFPADIFDAYEGDRPGVPRKPDPAHVNIVLEKMNVRPEETVYLGDSGVDMQTAVNAKALPIGVLWGFREKDELLENGAKILLSQPSELLEKVDFLNNKQG